jgi:integrase
MATVLSYFELSRLRACEIKARRWRDVHWDHALIEIRRSKTPAGWRSPTLNATCQRVLRSLHDQAAPLGFTKPDHFVFPWHGRAKRIDPTRGMTSWRTAWRSIRKAAGLTDVRFHELLRVAGSCCLLLLVA